MLIGARTEELRAPTWDHLDLNGDNNAVPPVPRSISVWRLRLHSFVSLLSSAKVPIEDIARLVGHNGTAVTELVYRHQIRPVMEEGATAMDRIFARRSREA
ncbi:hypothetical protein GCM10017566_67570 [Amycolatopsis bartoniae]|uniref:Tyr recombinase domain-containing protein n=1 Tax=Amycolatopsis bartoniae TaxID=941986 RepID=A0A8H9MF70_9PSEU|nr:hypothetical protein GCM10017566_67570 [Amycolatopsis bartoniae]